MPDRFDGKRRDELLAYMPTNKTETRLQEALLEPRYPLPLLRTGLSFTYRFAGVANRDADEGRDCI